MGAPMQNPWELQLEALGEYIRAQRRHANLSLRELAALTQVSNAYLSQLERGMHEPSVRVLRSVAAALDVSVETMLAQAGLFADEPGSAPGDEGATEAAVRADPRLTDAQKEALLAVYRSMANRA
jgi:transcriptional regulator with XRE-family HTH domain